MSATSDLFSIVMCFRNPGKLLTHAISSVIAQDYKNWELILIDDASDDSTVQQYRPYMDDPRFRIHCNRGAMGISANKGLACRLATGKYIAIVDGDDWLEPQALSSVIKAYRADPRRALVHTRHTQISPSGNSVPNWVRSYPSNGSTASGTDVVSHLLTFRRAEYYACGGYDETLPFATDKQIVSALESVTYPFFLDRTLYNYRVPQKEQPEATRCRQKVIASAKAAEAGVSFIIPYHKRQDNLRSVLGSIKNLKTTTPYEVVLMCWMDEYNASSFPFVRAIPSSQGDFFNRGALLNAGARLAKYRKLFFLDCDVVVPSDFMSDLQKNIAYKKAYFPICHDTGTLHKGSGKPWRSAGYGLCGMMKRDLFWSGGWPQFDQWGGEDNFLYFKMKHDGCQIIRNARPGLMHLEHPYFGDRSPAIFQTRQIRLKEMEARYRAYCRGNVE